MKEALCGERSTGFVIGLYALTLFFLTGPYAALLFYMGESFPAHLRGLGPNVAHTMGPVGAIAGSGLLSLVLSAGASMTVAAFVAGSVASLAIVRPIARRHLRTPPHIRTGAAALIGQSATVLERVDADGGMVKIGGEVWTARAYDEDHVIEPGRRVEVLKIEGATALVSE
jgi:membrane protein implicated in regulation of membrane protease activity